MIIRSQLNNWSTLVGITVGWVPDLGAQHVTLDNKIKCLSLALFFWAAPPMKL